MSTGDVGHFVVQNACRHGWLGQHVQTGTAAAQIRMRHVAQLDAGDRREQLARRLFDALRDRVDRHRVVGA